MSTVCTHLLYLHGFRSSPSSAKAQRLARQVTALQAQPLEGGRSLTWVCPPLPPSPAEAVALIESLTAHWPTEGMAVVGSSLGGFYATVLARRRGCRLAVINPAVQPARDLARHLGEQTPFQDPQERLFFRAEFIDELQALDPFPLPDTADCWALVAQGDEVLDWREMVAHYPGAALRLIPGSDHAVSDFEAHLPALLDFLNLPREIIAP